MTRAPNTLPARLPAYVHASDALCRHVYAEDVAARAHGVLRAHSLGERRAVWQAHGCGAWRSADVTPALVAEVVDDLDYPMVQAAADFMEPTRNWRALLAGVVPAMARAA